VKEMVRMFYIGYKFITKDGYEVEVIEFVKGNYYKVMFTDFIDVIKTVPIKSIKEKSVKNPYHPNTFGVGYLGVGDYSTTYKDKKIYILWNSIIRRSYSEVCKKHSPTYKNVTVCDEWLNFQNFAKWYEDNYPHHIQDIKFHLDKDVLQLRVKNKIYSPNTCIFLPHNVNMFLTNKKSNNTSGIIGVTFNKSNGDWTVTGNDFNTNKRVLLKTTKAKEKIFEFSEIYKNFRLKNIEYIKKYLISLDCLNVDLLNSVINNLIMNENDDMLLEQKDNFIQINYKTGFTENDIERVIKCLNN
jgi:hypothetical protein